MPPLTRWHHVEMPEASAAVEHEGTLWVLEDPPPATRPRWYCHLDGSPAPAFDDVDEAVRWGLENASTVLVRTLGTAWYRAGEPSPDWDYEDEPEPRPWPPSTRERRKMDDDYTAALAAADEEQNSRADHERAREEWLATHGSRASGNGPLHQCLISAPDDDCADIEFEELVLDGTECGARRQGSGVHAFGTAAEVLAAVTARSTDDPWIDAVCAALARERTWLGTGRRSMLAVGMGTGEHFHATAVQNRESISQHGLDWNRMGSARGIAGSNGPELPAIFLCETLGEIPFFTGMSRVATDVWAVRVDGLWIESGPDGWVVVAEPIGIERLRLAETDIPAGRGW
jgi:hypothetical protein